MNLYFDSLGIFARFLVNVVVLLVLLRLIYFRRSRDRDMLFGFFMFGQGVYFISALMHDVEISMGFAFGLFAVLSMLRYRTESMSIRDMTYLFLVIVISLMYAVAPIGIVNLITITSLLCLIAALSESDFFAPRITSQRVIYDSVGNISEKNSTEIIQELTERLGVQVLAVEVREIDLLRDSAVLVVQYDQ